LRELTSRQLFSALFYFSCEGANPMPICNFVFAYFSPETMLPATSIIATIAGILMMLGRGSLRYVLRIAKGARRSAGRIAATSKPHLQIQDKAYRESPVERSNVSSRDPLR
jgi:ABC-type lipoprotein release transport system permease subunit